MRANRLQQSLRALMWMFAALALLAVSGCSDESNPGEGQPKRAVDPRSEALRYFPAKTPAIALLEVTDQDGLTALDDGLAEVPGWQAARDRVLRSLRAAGIDPQHILDLGANATDEIDLPAPELAFGIVPGSGSRENRELFSFATEQGVALDMTFREAAERGDLTPAGQFDGARLYRGPDLDFAIRDGVLIAAADINRLQQAITRRDGDRDGQLDDAPITALLNELPQRGTLRAWAGPGPEAEALLSLLATASRPEGGEEATTEATPASEAAAEINGDDGRLTFEVIVRTDAPEAVAPTTEEDAPDDDPVPIAISATAIADAFAELPADSPLQGLRRVAPLAGATWIDGSAVRARLISAN